MPEPDIRRYEVLGTPLCAIDYAELIQRMSGFAASKRAVIVDFANTNIVTLRRHDRHFQSLTANVNYFIPDGMPLVWCMNARGAALRDRVYGPTFTRQFLESCPPRFTHYLIGGF